MLRYCRGKAPPSVFSLETCLRADVPVSRADAGSTRHAARGERTRDTAGPVRQERNPAMGSDSAFTRRAMIALVSGVVLGAVIAAAAILGESSKDAGANEALIVGPSTDPDATLEPTGIPPDHLITRLLEPPEATHLEIDLATLPGFGEHDGVDVWPASNAFGSPCLIAIHGQTADVLGTSRIPAGAMTFVDTQ